MVNIKGFMSKAKTNKTIAMKTVQTYHDGKPSRYKTKIKTLKIKALPGSWSTINNIGRKRIPSAWICLFISLRLTCTSLKYLAKAKAVDAFTNSDGCMPKEPNEYQFVLPLIVFPKTNNQANDSNPIT